MFIILRFLDSRQFLCSSDIENYDRVILFSRRYWIAFHRTDVIFTGFDIVSGNIEAHKREFAGKPWKFEVSHNVLH